MKLIVCVDKNNGIMFNNRRVSKDSVVVKDIISLVQDKKLYCSEYSSELFKDNEIELNITNDLQISSTDNFYFLEDIKPNLDSLDEIIIYNWNRAYPSDVKFTISLSDYHIINQIDLIGTSHEQITKTTYKRGEEIC